MNKIQYKEYLNSEHWITFRRSIYSKRNRCQRCGITKTLNIHHITYKNLGKETNDDVLVLCNFCHFKGHQKKKYIKRMKTGEPLDFVKKAKNPNSVFYNASDIFRDCNRCGGEHSLFYKKFVSGRLTLAMACPNSKPRTYFIKFEPNLDIPVFDTLKLKKQIK